MANRKTYASMVLELSFATERIFEVKKKCDSCTLYTRVMIRNGRKTYKVKDKICLNRFKRQVRLYD